MTNRDNCPICNNHKFERIMIMNKWSVDECTRCKLGVTHPFPDKESLSTLYDENYFQPKAQTYDVGSPDFKKKVAQEAHRIRFVKKTKKKGHLLDVGCGNGFFLYAAKQKGFTVEGLDISDSNKSLIENNLGVKVSVCSVEKMDYPKSYFDVITMWHSLEHNPDPKLIIQKSLSWLKPDGTLIIEVPNHGCVDAKIHGEKWPNWALPFHLYHFTMDSLLILAASCGLSVVATNTYLSEYIKETMDKKPALKFFSRMIARQFDGGGAAIACKKTQDQIKVGGD